MEEFRGAALAICKELSDMVYVSRLEFYAIDDLNMLEAMGR